MASTESTIIRVLDILDIVLARLDNLEHEIVELKTEDVMFQNLKNRISNLESRIHSQFDTKHMS